MYINSKIQKCLEIANKKGLVNLKFVDIGDQSLMDIAKEYAESKNLHVGKWTCHNTNGLVGFETILLYDDIRAVETICSIMEY